MMGLSFGIFAMMLAALYIVSVWKVFEKAGQPGWAVLIPFYNLYTYAKVAGLHGMSIVLYLLPFINIFYHFSLNIRVAKRFGYSNGMGFLLAISPGIIMPVLAFGDNTYKPAENYPNSVAKEKHSQEKSSKPSIFTDENGDLVEQIRLEDW